MFGESVLADLQIISEQSVVLPLANHESALHGDPPIGIILPTPAASAPFSTQLWYYLNYTFKIEGGAIFFRDLHPDTYEATSWVFLGLGLLALAGSCWIPSDKADETMSGASTQPT
jgi:hypothetical protein